MCRRFLLCVMLISITGALRAQQRDSLAKKDVRSHRKMFTAPDPEDHSNVHKESEVIPLVYIEGAEIIPPEHHRPKVKFYEVKNGDDVNMSAGFYAEFRPNENDTLFLFDSASTHFDEVQIQAGKEVYQSDSVTVVTDIGKRLSEYDAQGKLITNRKKGKTNSMVIRSGFIPTQGFGSKRYRFGVIPGNFKIGMNSIISASVHMLHGSAFGTVLCAVTKIDYEHNMFFVETSNEIPRGENINWIIVNAP